MAQIFPPWWNKLPIVVAIAGSLGPTLAVAGVWYFFSPWYTDVGYRPVQPVPYSHKLHVGDLGLDCRYCHQTVESSPHASIPPTSLCMNCHSQIWNASPHLQVVRSSYIENRPIVWQKVNDLPDFVYFNHSIHVAKGVGCVSCHGRVDRMAAVEKVHPLTMSWCLDCHRNPEPNLRPVEEITNMDWKPEGDPVALGKELAARYDVHTRTSCTTCHR